MQTRGYPLESAAPIGPGRKMQERMKWAIDQRRRLVAQWQIELYTTGEGVDT